MTLPIRRFLIESLHGKHDVIIEFEHPISIFVGPNGIGKSTTINIFVLLLSRQWRRLSKQPFATASVEFTNGDFVCVTKAECMDSTLDEFPSRFQKIAQKLIDTDHLMTALEGNPVPLDIFDDTDHYSPIRERDVVVFRNQLLQYQQTAQHLISLARTSKLIRENFDRKLIFLPTYRRIEQEVSEIFSLSPRIMENIREQILESFDDSSSDITEIIRFGMDDVVSLIERHTAEIKEFSRQEINTLSTRYLTAAIRPGVSFPRHFYVNLSDDRINEVLSRVDDEQLKPSQRKDVVNLIKSLRNRVGAGRGRLKSSQEQIGSYFFMLAETHDKISIREAPLKTLASVLNKYIGPSKRAIYDSSRYEFAIKSDETTIPLSGLSSGEKQILSLFSNIILSKEKRLYVVIDEPELSLSVLWQENLIEDIISLETCQNILAATHSPFIFGKKLARFTRDLTDSTRPAGESGGHIDG